MNNFSKTFSKLVSTLPVKITQSSALETLGLHPEPYTLLAYSETLNKFQIDNAAVKIEQEQLSELPLPFITYHSKNGGSFTLVRAFENNLVNWYHTEKGWKKNYVDEFVKDWNGIAFLTEVGENSGESNYSKTRTQELLKQNRKPFALALIFITVVILFSRINITGLQYFIPIFLLLGVAISSVILFQSFGYESTISERICNSGGKTNECQNILQSTSSKITSWLSLADIGFVYFTSTFLYFLSSQLEITSIVHFNTWLFHTSILGIIFSIYSIYVQGFVLKIWCKLCMAIIFLFWLLFITQIFLTGDFQLPINTNFNILEILLVSGLPVSLLMLSKYSFIDSAILKQTSKKLSRLQSNPKVLNALLEGQKSMPERPHNLQSVNIGNPTASNIITMISNPLCSPCAEMHNKVENLIKKNENIKCEVIFLSNPNTEDVGHKFVKYLLSLPKEIQNQAMCEWFSKNTRNLDSWFKPFKELSRAKDPENNAQIHLDWINKAEIKGTPTLFLNGKLIPEDLRLEDLVSFNMDYIGASDTNGKI